MRIHRLRFIIQATRKFDVHAHQCAEVYATLAHAAIHGTDHQEALPDGMRLEAPERCRVAVLPGEPFAFGFSLIGYSDKEAGELTERVRRGFVALGHERPRRGTPFRGTFELATVEDLVASSALPSGGQPIALGEERFAEDAHRIHGRSQLTIRFDEPLRMQRPKSKRTPGHGFFDGNCFLAPTFMRRLFRRLDDIGSNAMTVLSPDLANECKVTDNRLFWLDLKYGSQQDRKSLGGAVGRVTLCDVHPDLLEPLVLGQYVGVGNNTRFGFGSYRIEELGEQPNACRRSRSLLNLALDRADAGAIAERLDLPSGALRSALDALREGRYSPTPPFFITLSRAGARARKLAIPPRLDRGVQRVVLETLAPGLDVLFEDSSMAYRRGFSRSRAAMRIRRAYRDGFKLALKTDFESFFDTIDHDRLQERLQAYVADGDVIEQLMTWVRSGAPEAGRGLPTGAPLSPVLANLFLDGFDESVARRGHRLVRYADDFLILFKNEKQAERIIDETTREAERLRLALNTNKTELIDLRHPFRFLGFRFERRGDWIAERVDRLLPLDDIGWTDAIREPSQALHVPLPGELPDAPPTDRPAVIVGPDLERIDRKGGAYHFHYSGGRTSTSVTEEGLGELVLLGAPDLSAAALSSLLRRGTPALFAEPSGGWSGLLVSGAESLPGDLLEQLVLARRDPVRRVSVARRLIQAKLVNHAALAEAVLPGASIAAALRDSAERCLEEDSIPTLLGLEGSAAAKWYRALPKALGRGFSFERRVAPAAGDPVNALMNLGHSLVHRLSILALRAVGLVPTLGFLHEPSPGHASLASDLQEPFRHLVDRAVFAATLQLNPNDFQEHTEGPWSLRIKPRAARTFTALLMELLATPVIATHSSEPISYRRQLVAQARSLRAHIADPSKPFQPFQHP